MKKLIFALSGFLLLQPHFAEAHGDHDYREPRIVSESIATIIAQRATTSMTKKDVGLGFGQLSQSWTDVAKDDLSVFKKGSDYYVISVPNKEEEKTLYVLMSDRGEVYDANLSGDFHGID